MDRVWVFETCCLTMAVVDFLDPALADRPDARERGVRLEARPVRSVPAGSVYASDEQTLLPAVLRIDLLESAPGAADRMHWHPVMAAGEPGARLFDEAIPADPRAWLTALLADLGPALTAAGADLGDASSRDVASLAVAADEIVAATMTALQSTRGPWPRVEHDARGLARSAV